MASITMVSIREDFRKGETGFEIRAGRQGGLFFCFTDLSCRSVFRG